MGLSISSLMGQAQPMPTHVLVPPLFERDVKNRDRFVETPYAYLCGDRKDLAHLFQDFLAPSHACRVLFSPPADRRLTVDALVSLQQSQMVLRYQPLGVHNVHTFIDWQGNSKRPGDATLRASIFDPDSGLGMFGSMPCAKRVSGALAQVGIRYSSPQFTTGAVVQPRSGELASIWLAGRHGGVLGAAEIEPKASVTDISSALQRMWKDGGMHGDQSLTDLLRQRSKVALAYEPTFNTPAGQGRFSACIELRNGQTLAVSFFQHMAVSRRVYNPTEAKNVAGITNYVDLGMEIIVPTIHSNESEGTGAATTAGQEAKAGGSATSSGRQQKSSGSEAGPKPQTSGAELQESGDVGSVNLGASWQINKNWLLKVRVGSDSVAGAVAVRNWHTVGLIAVLNASWRYGDWRGPRLGGYVQLENFGALRYERGVSEASGRAVLQRHEAEAIDIANMEGQGKQVKRGALRSEYDIPPPDTTRNFL